MTKPKNFPERKRQRQIKALAMRSPMSAKGNSNAAEIASLQASIAMGDQRGVRTKKYRGPAKPTFKPAA